MQLTTGQVSLRSGLSGSRLVAAFRAGAVLAAVTGALCGSARAESIQDYLLSQIGNLGGTTAGTWQNVPAQSQTAQISGNGDGNSISPAVVTDGDSVYCCWAQKDGSDTWQIYLRAFDGTAWEELGGSATGGGLSNTQRDSVRPRLALQDTGRGKRLWVVWQEGQATDLLEDIAAALQGVNFDQSYATLASDIYTALGGINFEASYIFVKCYDLATRNGTWQLPSGADAATGISGNAADSMASRPDICMTSSGPFVVWDYMRFRGTPVQDVSMNKLGSIYGAAYDEGAAWRTTEGGPVDYDDSAGTGISGKDKWDLSVSPRVVVDAGTGQPVVAWVYTQLISQARADTYRTAPQVHIRRYNPSGPGAWEGIGSSDGEGGVSQEVAKSCSQIALTPFGGNRLAAVYTVADASGVPQGQPPDMQVSGVVWDNTQWTTYGGQWSELSASMSAYATGPDLGLDAAGNPVVAWVDTGTNVFALSWDVAAGDQGGAAWETLGQSLWGISEINMDLGLQGGVALGTRLGGDPVLAWHSAPLTQELADTFQELAAVEDLDKAVVEDVIAALETATFDIKLRRFVSGAAPAGSFAHIDIHRIREQADGRNGVVESFEAVVHATAGKTVLLKAPTDPTRVYICTPEGQSQFQGAVMLSYCEENLQGKTLATDFPQGSYVFEMYDGTPIGAPEATTAVVFGDGNGDPLDFPDQYPVMVVPDLSTDPTRITRDQVFAWGPYSGAAAATHASFAAYTAADDVRVAHTLQDIAVRHFAPEALLALDTDYLLELSFFSAYSTASRNGTPYFVANETLTEYDVHVVPSHIASVELFRAVEQGALQGGGSSAFFEAGVEATSGKHLTVVDPNGVAHALALEEDSRQTSFYCFEDTTPTTLNALDTAYPQGPYIVTVYADAGRTIVEESRLALFGDAAGQALPFPQGAYPNLTQPQPSGYGVQAVSSQTYGWDAYTGSGDASHVAFSIVDSEDDDVASHHAGIGTTQHTPNPVNPGDYGLALAFLNQFQDTTDAGTVLRYVNGRGTNYTLTVAADPSAVTVDTTTLATSDYSAMGGTLNLYVACEGNGGGGTDIVKIDHTGAKSVAGSGFNGPSGLAIQPSTNTLYISDDRGALYSQTTGGTFATLLQGQFTNPNALSFRDGNHLLVGDAGNRVMEADLAAGPSAIVLGQGFGVPQGVGFYGQDTYFSDSTGNVFFIEPTDPTPVTLGSARTLALGVVPNTSGGMVIDSAGTIYVSDYFGNAVRKVTQAGVVSTVIAFSNSIAPRGLALHPSDENILFITGYTSNEIIEYHMNTGTAYLFARNPGAATLHGPFGMVITATNYPTFSGASGQPPAQLVSSARILKGTLRLADGSDVDYASVAVTAQASVDSVTLTTPNATQLALAKPPGQDEWQLLSYATDPSPLVSVFTDGVYQVQASDGNRATSSTAIAFTAAGGADLQQPSQAPAMQTPAPASGVLLGTGGVVLTWGAATDPTVNTVVFVLSGLTQPLGDQVVRTLQQDSDAGHSYDADPDLAAGVYGLNLMFADGNMGQNADGVDFMVAKTREVKYMLTVTDPACGAGKDEVTGIGFWRGFTSSPSGGGPVWGAELEVSTSTAVQSVTVVAASWDEIDFSIQDRYPSNGGYVWSYETDGPDTLSRFRDGTYTLQVTYDDGAGRAVQTFLSLFTVAEAGGGGLVTPNAAPQITAPSVPTVVSPFDLTWDSWNASDPAYGHAGAAIWLGVYTIPGDVEVLAVGGVGKDTGTRTLDLVPGRYQVEHEFQVVRSGVNADSIPVQVVTAAGTDLEVTVTTGGLIYSESWNDSTTSEGWKFYHTSGTENDVELVPDSQGADGETGYLRCTMAQLGEDSNGLYWPCYLTAPTTDTASGDFAGATVSVALNAAAGLNLQGGALRFFVGEEDDGRGDSRFYYTNATISLGAADTWTTRSLALSTLDTDWTGVGALAVGLDELLQHPQQWGFVLANALQAPVGTLGIDSVQVARRPFTLTLEPGWNLVSFPYDTTMTVAQIFDDGSRGSLKAGLLQGWNPALQSYTSIPDTSVPAPKAGYWAYSPAGGACQPVVGSPASSIVQLAQGWNLIGPVFPATVPENSIVVNGPWWDWLEDTQVYGAVGSGESLEPGEAYWAEAAADSERFVLDMLVDLGADAMAAEELELVDLASGALSAFNEVADDEAALNELEVGLDGRAPARGAARGGLSRTTSFNAGQQRLELTYNNGTPSVTGDVFISREGTIPNRYFLVDFQNNFQFAGIDIDGQIELERKAGAGSRNFELRVRRATGRLLTMGRTRSNTHYRAILVLTAAVLAIHNDRIELEIQRDANSGLTGDLNWTDVDEQLGDRLFQLFTAEGLQEPVGRLVFGRPIGSCVCPRSGPLHVDGLFEELDLEFIDGSDGLATHLSNKRAAAAAVAALRNFVFSFTQSVRAHFCYNFGGGCGVKGVTILSHDAVRVPVRENNPDCQLPSGRALMTRANELLAGVQGLTTRRRNAYAGHVRSFLEARDDEQGCMPVDGEHVKSRLAAKIDEYNGLLCSPGQ